MRWAHLFAHSKLLPEPLQKRERHCLSLSVCNSDWVDIGTISADREIESKHPVLNIVHSSAINQVDAALVWKQSSEIHEHLDDLDKTQIFENYRSRFICSFTKIHGCSYWVPVPFWCKEWRMLTVLSGSGKLHFRVSLGRRFDVEFP